MPRLLAERARGWHNIRIGLLIDLRLSSNLDESQDSINDNIMIAEIIMTICEINNRQC